MVLITGATGLVGSHLALHLIENGESVRAIYRNPASLSKIKSLFQLYKKENLFEKIEWIQADITDVPSLERTFDNIDYVYHCAALISFDPKDEINLRKINIEGTANIVNFSLVHNIKKLCFVSSIAALGDLKESENIVNEETEWNPEKPHSDYAISKYGAEMEIWRGQQEGLQVGVINPGVILGPGFWDNGSGEVFRAVAKGLPFYTDGSTGFVAVSDVVAFLVQLMKSEINGDRFIVISENIPFRETLNTIADGLKVKRPRLYAPFWLTELAWRVDWLLSNVFGQKTKFSKDTARASHASVLYSNEKAKKIFRFPFQEIKTYIPKVIVLQTQSQKY
ncbi:NAD-dependent epimerase/dehydratase family protein [Flavobacterium sp. GT3R68]|uniref:NAD-dependent epimerase/dehydratase family protein n=1 Tax=Flavobacterium sp. GT3R68 TaxID=2594437 RepID=UPI000F895962|nr:NAD-dependent epimerase/dehydratase family protein [Flavobacterium sp. GT3R68]RTY91338.1 NAD-dependent epimerase/dehydratase family protein [Flavobacterium sp. GSN2]TRW93964.1 NAD-dependent epimerase/dehydratase family protein [Flavobacterium sp. GT3R68]